MKSIVVSLRDAAQRLFRKPPEASLDDQLSRSLDDMLKSGMFRSRAGMSAVTAVLLADMQRERRLDRRLREDEARWKRYRRMTLTVMALSGVIAWTVLYLYRNGFKLPVGNPVAVVSITGEIGTEPAGMAENIIPAMRRAFANKDSKGVILRINSPGGLPVDSERVNRELDALKKQYPDKEVTAVIETVGASAAYMMAVHADRICAAKYSLVGSVGIILNAWNVHGLAERLEVNKEAFGSGKYKSLLDPFKALTDDDRAKVFSLVNEMGNTFATEVISQRKARLKLSRDELATGEAWAGTQALKNGLVDDLCTVEMVAAKYGATPRDYGPYASADWSLTGVSRAFGAAAFQGFIRAAESSGVGNMK